MSRLQIITNFVLFQAAWFACVLSAAHQVPWYGFCFAMIVVLAQLSYAPRYRHAFVLMVVVAILGAVVDQIFIQLSIVQYQSHGWSQSWVPVWIIGLWIAFSSTLNVSLRWLRDKTIFQLILGAVGGTLAYIAAQKLGAVSITPTQQSYVVMASCWGVMTVVLFAMAKRWDGYHV